MLAAKLRLLHAKPVDPWMRPDFPRSSPAIR
jgi:hypothetical protein